MTATATRTNVRQTSPAVATRSRGASVRQEARKSPPRGGFFAALLRALSCFAA